MVMNQTNRKGVRVVFARFMSTWQRLVRLDV